jgi:DNA invertase Pin-like site-specific DNA recombinase
MTDATPHKVAATHLARRAFLYVRQSTLRQVAENQESTRRQYALRERATALGWTAEQIVVIDCDLGLSGATAEREGFQRLVAEVGMGHAGIVLGLEVSRLARNSTDWHRLLEICALTETLILDEDGLYDPTHYNDRLLLGLKGTISEAELHLLRARMRGGLLAKARRGELRIGLPVGFVYDELGHVVLHPDAQVRDTLALLFRTFQRTGAACATVKHFSEQQIPFPAPARSGTRTAQVVWGRLNLGRAIQLLHNPRYAGAFAYGRRQDRKQPDGRFRTTRVPRDQWIALRLDAHPGYISWDEFERIQDRLRASALAYGMDRHHGPPREGPALLQGRVLCGRCGVRMTVRYHRRRGQLVPDYVCCVRTLQHRDPPCQILPGGEVDKAIGRLLVTTITPLTLELTLAVQAELETRLDEVDRLRRQQIERVEHEAERARRRYLHVDPTNRLVAASLEADWNDRLRAVAETRDRVEQQRAADRAAFDERAQQRIRALAADVPAVWDAPATTPRERKRILGLLLEDVTLLRQDDQITLSIRFRGGATTTLRVPVRIGAWRGRKTPPTVVARAATLLASHTDADVAALLNADGLTTGAEAPFDVAAMQWLRQRYGLSSRREHLLAAGTLTAAHLAARLGITASQVRHWRADGHLTATRCNDKEWLYDPIEQQSLWIQERAACEDRRLATPRDGRTVTSATRGAV